MQYKRKRGFTLIELLVVVLIIGILAAVALPQYNKTVEKSRVAGYWTVLKSMFEAQKVCKLHKGEECNLEEIDLSVPTCNPLPSWQGECHFYFTPMDNQTCAAVWTSDLNPFMLCDKGFYCVDRENGVWCSKYEKVLPHSSDNPAIYVGAGAEADLLDK